MCISLWGEDLVEGVSIEEGSRQVQRNMPSFTYEGLSRPDKVVPQYKTAIFGSFPIPKLVVVNDPEADSHEESMNKAKKANLPVRLVDE
jgi:hypothetical protein